MVFRRSRRTSQMQSATPPCTCRAPRDAYTPHVSSSQPRPPNTTPTPAYVSASSHRRLSVCLSPQADINARGQVNETPLHLAVQYGQTEACELLLSQGSRLKDGLAAGSCRWLAVHLAANEDRPEVLFQLLLRPAEVDAEAGDGSTPLQAHTRRR